jgi:hypothetical protein
MRPLFSQKIINALKKSDDFIALASMPVSKSLYVFIVSTRMMNICKSNGSETYNADRQRH